MSLIVQKFGGSSVKNAERINNVARIIAEKYLEGNDIIVVLSAQGDTTDDLIEKAREINPSASKREMDMLNELLEKGKEVTYEEVLSDMITRDKNDSSRALAPCVPAEDAIMFDNSGLDIVQTTQEAVKLINKVIGRC